MASVNNDFFRGVNPPEENQPTFKAFASAAISPNRLVYPTSTTAKLTVAQVASVVDPRVVGASGDLPIQSGDEFSVKYGRVAVAAGSVVKVGDYLIADANGKVRALASTTNTGNTIASAVAGLAFTNQPANDTITVVSAGAGDTTQTVTIYGTTHGGVTLVKETVSLNGTTPVDTIKTDWGVVVAVTKSAATAGTVTVKEKSGGATITAALTAAVLSVGRTAATTAYAYGSKPIAVASGTSTKTLGLICTSTAGAEVLQAIALTNTTPVTLATAVYSVDYILTGDVETTRTVTVTTGTGANATSAYTLAPVGMALTPGSSGDVVDVMLFRPA